MLATEKEIVYNDLEYVSVSDASCSIMYLRGMFT